MSYVAHKNKVRRETLSQLEKDIRILEQDHSLTKEYNYKSYNALSKKWVLYNNLCTSKVEAALARTNYHYYEFGNKTSKLLAWQIKKEDSEKYIHSIKAEDGRCLEDPKDINLELKKYYPSTV